MPDKRISVCKPFPNLRQGAFIVTEASPDYEVDIGKSDIFIRSKRKYVNKHILFDKLTFENGEYNKFCVINFDVISTREFKEYLSNKGFLVYGELQRRSLIEFWWQINLYDLINFLPEFTDKFRDEANLVADALDRVVEIIINKPKFFTNLIKKYIKYLNKDESI